MALKVQQTTVATQHHRAIKLGAGIMDGDRLAHCRRAARPSVVWVQLCLLSFKYNLDDDVMMKIHRFVMNSTSAEKAGLDAFNEKLEREEKARRDAGAERPVRMYQLLGFATLNGYLAHVHLERQAEAKRAAKEIPEWVLFGYENRQAFLRARRAAEKASRRRAVAVS